GGGGAIYSNSGVLTLDSCVFQGNVAADGNGGAVWAEGGNVTILGGEFVGNNASVFGAVALRFAIADITGSVFRGNYAEFSGGALLGGNGTGITVNRCEFGNNIAVEYGGAIAASSLTGYVSNGCEFVNNTALEFGGAISASS
ncbi:unnamed protein product, partial [Laminaria digitata]